MPLKGMSESSSSSALKIPDDEFSKDSESVTPVVSHKRTFLAAFSALLYIFAMGMTISYTAPATVDMKRPGRRMRGITDNEITWIGSLTMLGGMPANALAGYITQKYGRKSVIMLSSPLFLSSQLMISYATNIGWLYAARCISGFCTGLYCVANQAYIAEIAPQEIRGLLSSGFPLAVNLGMFAVMGLGIILRWTWLAFSIAAVIACASCMMAFMPESPVWLIRDSKGGEAMLGSSKRRKQDCSLIEAENGIKFLLGKKCNPKKEVERIIENFANQQQNEGISLQDFKDPTLFKPLIISIFLMFFHQACGSSPVLSFTVEIFQRAGSSIAPDVAATILTIVQIVANFVCLSIIDKFGRRKIYIVSGIITASVLVVLGCYSLLIVKHPEIQQSIGFIPLISFSIYAFAFALGIGSVPFVMIPELVSVRYRSTVLSIATVFVSFFAFSITKSYAAMRSFLGDYGLYWTYSLFTFMSVLFGFFALPETKNLSFDEISQSFSKKKREPDKIEISLSFPESTKF